MVMYFYLPSYFFKMVFLVLRYSGHFFWSAMVMDAVANARIDCHTPPHNTLHTSALLLHALHLTSHFNNNIKICHGSPASVLFPISPPKVSTIAYFICVIHAESDSPSTIIMINLQIHCLSTIVWNCIYTGDHARVNVGYRDADCN